MRLGWGVLLCACIGLGAVGWRSNAAPPEVSSSCTKGAEPATISAVAADPGAFRGRCVRLAGLLIGPALYSDVDGYYLAGSRIAMLGPSDPARLRRVGMIFPSRYHGLGMAQARDAQITGTVSICAAHRTASAPEYCRSADGAVIVVSTLTSSPHVLRRLTDEASRARVGNLRAIAAGSPEGKALAKVAHAVLDDIRSGDVADFTALEGPGEDPDLFPGRYHALVFRDPASPYAALRTSSGEPQVALFRVIDRAGQTEAATRDHRTVFCYCRDSTCSGRWPISLADSANSVERPYVCFARSVDRNGASISSTEEIRALKEPAAQLPEN